MIPERFLQVGASLALAIFIGTAAPPAVADESLPLRKITIDATTSVGSLRPLSGVNGAPAREFGLAGGANAQAAAAIDGLPLYRAAGIDLIRVHDEFGPGDIDTIFPDMSADADDPKSYHFDPTDRLIASIRSVAAEPLFRLGRSSGSSAEPPADLDKFAAVARHILMHYNQGWDKGFHYGIRYWEIWNEPDSKSSWSGPPGEYYVLYEKTARALEAADANALIGGPSIAKPLDDGAYREDFLRYVRWRNLPIGFFSWHFSAADSHDPYAVVTIARQVRSLLDAHGFGSTRNVLDQWNEESTDPELSQATQAAFAASTLIYMLGGPIDAQAYYRGDSALRRAGGPDAVGYALTAFGSLKRTPILLVNSGADDQGFALVAGRSVDRRLIQILISNYQIPAKYLGSRTKGDIAHLADGTIETLAPRRAIDYQDNAGYEATISMPSSGRYQVKRYRISESANYALVDQQVQSGPTLHLQAALPAPGIEFIVISAL
jgi:xylan 1,4-beta-xylosidase